MVSDETAIQNLVFRYAELIDAGDFAGVGDMFATAVITVENNPGARMAGAAEVEASYHNFTRRYPDNGTPHTKHVTTNLIVDVDAASGRGSCRSYFTVLQATDVLPLQPILSGRYHDTFACRDGEWSFATRHMFLDLMGDLSQHMLQSPVGD